MREFDYSHYKDLIIDPETLNLIATIHEFRGKQLYLFKQQPKTISRLINLAKIQSIKSSNRIEGIITSNKRIKDLALEKTKPKNRSEEEITGYRNVLNTIHQSYNYISINTDTILKFHKALYTEVTSETGGSFKKETNAIIKTDSAGNKTIIFKPLEPFQVPEAIHNICESFNQCIENRTIDPLLLIPLFIHDFLCIHPFTDGNGRISRLLTTLLLYQSGYDIGKYISLEKIIEDTKSEYYKALDLSGIGWKDNEENPLYFIKYLLKTILKAYQEFEERINLINKKLSAKEMVKEAFEEKIGKVTKKDLTELLPSLGLSTIEKALKELVEEGYIIREGRGKNTFYY